MALLVVRNTDSAGGLKIRSVVQLHGNGMREPVRVTQDVSEFDVSGLVGGFTP